MYNRGNYSEGRSSRVNENLEILREMLLERYRDDVALSELIRNADEQQMYLLTKDILMAQTGSWVGAANQVWDEVQNNAKLISSADAVQCTNSACGKYFWKDRQLINCTHCSTRLP